MKTRAKLNAPSRDHAFTLVEMIGVIAIMAILAATLTPNALRAIDRAAVRSEAETLRRLGDQTKEFVRRNTYAPGLRTALPRPTWYEDLSIIADLSPTDILTNRRQVQRRFIYEPGVATPTRVLILSQMRVDPTLTLPTAANLNTRARFDHVWTTPDGQVPPPGPDAWAGWVRWRAILNGFGGDYILIERVNLASIYATDLKPHTVTLNNKTPSSAPGPVVAPTDASYEIIRATGNRSGRISLLPSQTLTLPLLYLGDRLDLYRTAIGGTLDCSYVITGTTPRSFDFWGTNWIPQ